MPGTNGELGNEIFEGRDIKKGRCLKLSAAYPKMGN